MSTARSMSPLRRSEKSESQRSSPAAMRNCIARLAVVIGKSNACSNLISCACVRPNAPVMSAKTQTRAVHLAVDQQTHQSFVSEAGDKWKFALRYVKGGFGIAQPLIVKA